MSTYHLDCGHTAEFRHTAQNMFYSYTMGENANDLMLACPQGCGLRDVVVAPAKAVAR